MSARLVFVDESLRPNRYLLCAVTVEGSQAGQLRREVRGMLLAGQRRLPSKLECKRRRRVLLDQLVALELDVTIVQSRTSIDRSAEDVRAECLSLIVEAAQGDGQAATLYVERRDGLDHHDRLLPQALGPWHGPVSHDPAPMPTKVGDTLPNRGLPALPGACPTQICRTDRGRISSGRSARRRADRVRDGIAIGTPRLPVVWKGMGRVTV